MPQPPGLYGPLLYPTSTTGTAGLALDFTVVHPVGRRGAEYTCDENAPHRAYHVKVTKHHGWLQAKNYWFVPVVADTPGALHPETLRLLYDFARLKTDAAEQHAVANSQRRGTTFARLRSYTDHWEALGCALCLFTAPEISSTGQVRGRGFCLASR